MWRFMLTSIAALALVIVHSAGRAEVRQLGSDASSDDFVHALAPSPGAPAVKYRGLRVLNAEPAAAPEAATPSVAVDIKFARNSAALTPAAKATIRQIATALKSEQLAGYHFLLEGHTDTTGRADYNLRLSKLRAAAVREELVRAYGIDAGRIEADGKGQQDLLDPAHPTSAVNRRVQIVNLGQ
jgi:OmpA-OmpF porin, OOP family